MDIFENIKQDHEKVKKIIDQLEKQVHSGKITKTAQTNFDKLCKELEVHMRAEEDVFYPALEQFDEAREKAMEAREEHHVAKLILGECKSLALDDEHFAAKLMVLKETLLHHINEEEGEIFEMCDELFEDEQIQEISKQFASDKKKVMQKI